MKLLRCLGLITLFFIQGFVTFDFNEPRAFLQQLPKEQQRIFLQHIFDHVRKTKPESGEIRTNRAVGLLFSSSVAELIRHAGLHRQTACEAEPLLDERGRSETEVLPGSEFGGACLLEDPVLLKTNHSLPEEKARSGEKGCLPKSLSLYEPTYCPLEGQIR